MIDLADHALDVYRGLSHLALLHVLVYDHHDFLRSPDCGNWDQEFALREGLVSDLDECCLSLLAVWGSVVQATVSAFHDERFDTRELDGSGLKELCRAILEVACVYHVVQSLAYVKVSLCGTKYVPSVVKCKAYVWTNVCDLAVSEGDRPHYDLPDLFVAVGEVASLLTCDV